MSEAARITAEYSRQSERGLQGCARRRADQVDAASWKHPGSRKPSSAGAITSDR
ncbi:hypothetical protein BZL30_8226 [Mycobacterium kansasii]|uniref:Uncharacterized protein n=1 Tax=Mycobacterium kansasii TaxID=1768 RepID=A0A1V3XDN2_MYCKA|nr:hypothetical protein BZL30_8226 [Mycobacterium kansasii]OOK77190.1 hypothetical protein BZL29_3252 [Mycobacterium kansasii]